MHTILAQQDLLMFRFATLLIISLVIIFTLWSHIWQRNPWRYYFRITSGKEKYKISKWGKIWKPNCVVFHRAPAANVQKMAKLHSTLAPRHIQRWTSKITALSVWCCALIGSTRTHTSKINSSRQISHDRADGLSSLVRVSKNRCCHCVIF